MCINVQIKLAVYYLSIYSTTLSAREWSMLWTHLIQKIWRFLHKSSVCRYKNKSIVTWARLCMYLAEKVILHPDLEGVPLLILANKQDKLVRAHLTSTLTCTGTNGCVSGCSATDGGGECFWHECGVYRWQRLQDTEDLCAQRVSYNTYLPEIVEKISVYNLYTSICTHSVASFPGHSHVFCV